ncbi:MAG: hypothetical protein M5U28_47455 [Sandaracinaceae bacterium]|nr:hypothetical protein [Sandaracinaceae bacterium]
MPAARPVVHDLSVLRVRAVTIVAAFALCATTACDPPAPALVVEVRTDFVPGLEFVAVRTEISRHPDGPTFVGAVPAVLGDPYLERVRLAELSGLSPGTWHVHTTLSDALGRLVASQVTSVELRTAQVATIVIDRDCGGVECPSIEEDPSRASCIGGECGPATCTEETPSGCPVECTVDADCPSSRCASGRCSVGICLLAPTTGACAADEWCDPDVGCVPLEARDAGTPDAGRDAGVPDAGAPNAGLPDAGPLDAGRDAGSPCGFAMCRSDGLPCGTCGSSTTTFGAIADLTLPGGVYELDSFSIAEGVTVTVTGTEPLQIRSRGLVRIAGALVLDGSPGEGRRLHGERIARGRRGRTWRRRRGDGRRLRGRGDPPPARDDR